MLARVGVLLALAFSATSAAGQAEKADLLRALDLAKYSAREWPPSFSARTSDHRRISLAELRGRVVLVNFWATWCQTCREEMQAFDQLHREFAREGLTVLGINTREPEPRILEFGRALDLRFPLALDPQGEVSALYGVVGLPTTFLIARDGRAVARAIGVRPWASVPSRTLIRMLLSEAAREK
jgi:peroxiredoxin